MVIPVLVTPFLPNGNPDVDSLCSLIKYLKGQNCEKFWLFGTGGEDFSLSLSERLLILEQLAKSEVCSLNSLFVGVGNLPFSHTIELFRLALDYGYNIFHFIQPSKVKSIESVFYQIKTLKSLKEEASLYAYFSDNYSRKLSYEDIVSLNRNNLLDCISGIKFSTSDVLSLKLTKKHFPGLDIIPAKAKQLILSLDCGYKSTTSIEACLHAPSLNKIITLYHSGMLDQAHNVHEDFLSLSQSLKTSACHHNFMNIAEVKYLLYKKGIIQYSDVSPDLVSLSIDDRLILDRHFSELN